MALKLLDNEQVVCSLQKTPLIWITPTLLGLLFLMAYGASSQDPRGGAGFFVFIFFVWFIVEVIRRIRYAGYVTNRRIILHYGLFLHEREMRFEQLEGVNIERYKSIFWHQVQVNGTGGTSTLFDYVSNYDEFKNAIYEAKSNLLAPNSQII